MDCARGDLVADADDAVGGRDDSEDDEEVLGRSYTKGAWGPSSKKRQQPRARQRRRRSTDLQTARYHHEEGPASPRSF